MSMEKRGVIGPDITPDLSNPKSLSPKEAAVQPRKTVEELDQQDQHKRDSDMVKDKLKTG
jgi:hypothetical protein